MQKTSGCNPTLKIGVFVDSNAIISKFAEGILFMKLFILAGLCLLGSYTFFFGGGSQQTIGLAQNRESAEEVLMKVSVKLNSLRSLKYKYKLDLNYASEGYRAEFATDAFLDFTSVDKIIGIKYQFTNEGNLSVFNGSEKFDLNGKNKVIKIDEKPTSEVFKKVTFFYNSPATLRNVLPSIVTDAAIPKSITEKTINNQQYYVVEFVLEKKTLGRLSGYDQMEMDRKTIYRLTVDKSSYLPVEVLQKNSVNQDFMKAVFSDIEVNAASPDQLSWYYSSYLNEYKRAENAVGVTSLIAVGKGAPEWNLPVFGSSKTFTLSRFKNNVVLLEFWISQCGFCIAAVPKLNALANKYKGKDFKLLGVNAHDSKETIKLFQKNNKPIFELLNAGEETTKTYGVEGFPTIVLIDKTGKVIYSGSLDEQKLEELINKNIR